MLLHEERLLFLKTFWRYLSVVLSIVDFEMDVMCSLLLCRLNVWRVTCCIVMLCAADIRTSGVHYLWNKKCTFRNEESDTCQFLCLLQRLNHQDNFFNLIIIIASASVFDGMMLRWIENVRLYWICRILNSNPLIKKRYCCCNFKPGRKYFLKLFNCLQRHVIKIKKIVF